MDVENTEQQTTEQTQQPADGIASRNDLIAAVREAGGAESADLAAEEADAAARAKAAEQTPAGAPPVEEDKIAAIMKAREASRQKRLDADEHAATITRQAEERAQRIIDEAKAEARRQADRELEERRAKYRESPTAAIRALAEDGNVQSVIDDVLREGTPEARALARARAEAAEAKKMAEEGKGAKEKLDQFLSEQKQREEQQLYASARDSFLSTHASKEVAPALYAQHRNADAVFRALDTQCREWEADGLKRGRDFDDATLVKYLENESRKELQSMGFSLAAPAHQSGAGAPAKEPGIAPKSAANGTRTLSAAMGSERRTSPRPLSELPREKQREALIEEVAAARRTNPDAVF